MLASSDTAAPEIFALENGKLRKLTSHNDALLSSRNSARCRTFRSRAKTAPKFTA